MSEIEEKLDGAGAGVLLVERELATLVVAGGDRKSWLNGLVTQDLAPLGEGAAALGLVVAKTGKIEAEVAMLLGADILVGLPADRAELIREKLDRHLIMEDATIELAPEVLVWVMAFGERAGDVVEIARAHGARAGLTRRSGLEVAVIAEPPIGGARAAVLASIPSSTNASAEAWNRFRVAHGIAERAVDYADDESYPQEAALERDEVSFAKGCYLGQEAVFMLEKRGHVQKRLVQLVSDAPLASGADIIDADGKNIGRVTSVSGRLSLGVVKYKHARDGRELHVGGVVARVTSLLAITPAD